MEMWAEYGKNHKREIVCIAENRDYPILCLGPEGPEKA